MSTLDQDLALFRQRRFLAMPLAGMLAWAGVSVAGALLPLKLACLVLFVLTGSIVYLGTALSRLTGENFMDKSRPRNRFDGLFLSTVGQAVLVYSIALPFYMLEPSSLPLSVGILTGLMWLPFGWMVGHWMPMAHTLVRTLLIVVAWHALPAQRMVVIPLIVVASYVPVIVWLERRWHGLRHPLPTVAAAAA